jgi:beta-lactamase class A
MTSDAAPSITLEELVERLDGRAAVFARRLDHDLDDPDDGIVVGDVDAIFPTGSAAKLFVLLTFLDQVESNQCDPERRMSITEAYRDTRGGSGVLRHLGAGLEPTLWDCATLMMIVSDNVATDLVLDAVGGPEAVNAALARAGIDGARLAAPSVWVMPPDQFGLATPRALAECWARLDHDDRISADAKRITWRHQHRDGFGRLVPFSPDLPDFGLPSMLRLWSKSGSYPTVSCEGGLFETDQARWVLAVMADDLADWGNGAASAGPTLRAEVSRLIFDRWHAG